MAIKKINLSGEIGWDIMPFMVEQEFSDANGEDIEMTMSTPGGSVFKGNQINETISNYKREFPKSQIILNILEANSMGSYIAANPAIDLRLVKDESVAMIHNPQGNVAGDYRVMSAMADFLNKYAGIMAISYSKKMKNSIKETRSIMDETTWFVGGKEIISAGLADGFMDKVKAKSDLDVDAIYASSKLRHKAVMKKVKDEELEDDVFEKISSIVKDFDNSVDKNTKSNNNVSSDSPAAGGENNNQEVTVMGDENKKPEINAIEIDKAGYDRGIKEEKERVKALLEMKNKKDFEGIELIHNRIDEGISSGESMEDLKLALGALLFKNDVSAAMDTNNIGDLNTPTIVTVSGEETKMNSNDKEKENEVI